MKSAESSAHWLGASSDDHPSVDHRHVKNFFARSELTFSQNDTPLEDLHPPPRVTAIPDDGAICLYQAVPPVP